MKRFLLSLVAILITTVGFAQDVIVMKDGSTIQSKVTKVTKSEVEYKKFDNQAGPTYTIKTKELQCINYENGTKDTFVAPGYDPNIVTNETATQYSNDKELLDIWRGHKKKGKTETAKAEKVKKEKASREVAKREVVRKVVTPEMKYKKGARLKVAGYTIGGISLAAGLTSVILGTMQKKYETFEEFSASDNLIHDYKGKIYNRDRESYFYIGYAVMATGIATGIPFIAKGSSMQKKNKDLIHSASIINKEINFNNRANLNIGIDILSNNFFYTQTPGIGVRYNF